MVSSVALSVVAVAALAASADAHGTLSKPGLKFTGTAYGGDFSATIPMSTLKAQGSDIFTNYPSWTANAASFGRAFKAQTTYTTFKDFVLKNQDMSKGRFSNPKTPECGFTTTAGASVQPLPDQLEWYGGQMNHPGPCEVWCDNEIVVPFTADCAATFPQGKIKYEKEKCVGKNTLTLYWMSTLLEWQVYIDCAKIGSGTTPAAPAATTAPKVAGEATAKPAATPATPAATPKPATPATTPKSATTPAPTSKCKVRRE